MSKKRGGGYEVGYGKPPKDTRFKKGAPSPNPHGRPPKIESIHASVLRCLSQEIKVTTADGEVRDMQKRDVIAERLVQKAANGDMQATKIICQIDEEQALCQTEQQAIVDAAVEEEQSEKNKKFRETILQMVEDHSYIKGHGIYTFGVNEAIHPTEVGQILIDILQGFQCNTIRTAEAYKAHFDKLKNYLDDRAFETISFWNRGFKKSDLL